MLVTPLFHGRIHLYLIYNGISLIFKDPAILDFKIIFRDSLIAEFFG